MTFLLQHAFFTSAAVATALLLHFFSGDPGGVDRYVADAMERTDAKRALLLLALGTYFACYLLRPVFYTGYHGGIIGDNYLFVHHSIENGGYYFMKHLYFPWIPGQLWQAVVRVGIFSTKTPYYLEQAFAFFSLPNRLAAGGGMLMCFAYLRHTGWGFPQAFMTTAWLGVSFGYWFWALQSSALGMITTATLLTLLFTDWTLTNQRVFSFAFCGLLTALCFYVHISSLYFCIGIAVAVIVSCLCRYWNSNRMAALFRLCAFALPGILLAVVYTRMAMRYYSNNSIAYVIAIIADNSTLGGFSWGMPELLRTLRDGLGASLCETLGLLQGGLSGPWDWSWCFIQLTALFFMLLSFRKFPLNSFLRDEKFRLHRILAVVLVTMLIGYGTRKTWLQYYAPLASVASLTLACFAFGNGRMDRRRSVLLAMMALVVSTFCLNGFGHLRVFDGEKVTDNSVYRRLDALEKQYGAQPLLLLAPKGIYPYNFDAIMSYYSLPGRLSKIRWAQPAPSEIPQIVKNSKGLVLAEDAKGSVYELRPGL